MTPSTLKSQAVSHEPFMSPFSWVSQSCLSRPPFTPPSPCQLCSPFAHILFPELPKLAPASPDPLYSPFPSATSILIHSSLFRVVPIHHSSSCRPPAPLPASRFSPSGLLVGSSPPEAKTGPSASPDPPIPLSLRGNGSSLPAPRALSAAGRPGPA